MDSPELFPAAGHDDDDLQHFSDFRLSMGSDIDTDSTAALPIALPAVALPMSSLDGADASLWNLISPCSDFGEMEEIPIDAQEEEDEGEHEQPEPEVSPRASDEPGELGVKANELTGTCGDQRGDDEEEPARYASSSDDESDEEVEVFNAVTAFAVAAKRGSWCSLDGKPDGSEKLDSVTEGDELDDMEVSSTTSSQPLFDDSTSEDGSFASHVSHPVPGEKWVGRIKARAYSGSASVKMHQAYQKIRARTLSATPMRRPSHDHEEDDGGFSSDDEDYDRERAPQRQSAARRINSFSLPTRLTAVKKVKLPTRLPSMMRFRSSSATTTSSEDSFISGNSSILDDADTDRETKQRQAQHPPLYNTQELKQKASACASRAAGLFGAASAEAARKLRTTRAFRSSPQPNVNPFARAASSPIVDRTECSPGLPPRSVPPSALAAPASG